MRTIIHIGTHKTGTTSIQHYLRDKKSLLKEKGLYVPSEIAGFSDPSHFILNVYSLADNRSSPMKDIFIATKEHDLFLGLEKRLGEDVERHYKQAIEQGCSDVIWSNEGLYLLNSNAEYQRLIALFSQYSSEVVVVCCFREVESYRNSYIKQLADQNIPLSKDKDSYRYVNTDSWLFDYERKKCLLRESFDNYYFYPYCSNNNVAKFMSVIGYQVSVAPKYRLNVTENRL